MTDAIGTTFVVEGDVSDSSDSDSEEAHERSAGVRAGDGEAGQGHQAAEPPPPGFGTSAGEEAKLGGRGGGHPGPRHPVRGTVPPAAPGAPARQLPAPAATEAAPWTPSEAGPSVLDISPEALRDEVDQWANEVVLVQRSAPVAAISAHTLAPQDFSASLDRASRGSDAAAVTGRLQLAVSSLGAARQRANGLLSQLQLLAHTTGEPDLHAACLDERDFRDSVDGESRKSSLAALDALDDATLCLEMEGEEAAEEAQRRSATAERVLDRQRACADSESDFDRGTLSKLSSTWAQLAREATPPIRDLVDAASKTGNVSAPLVARASALLRLLDSSSDLRDLRRPLRAALVAAAEVQASANAARQGGLEPADEEEIQQARGVLASEAERLRGQVQGLRGRTEDLSAERTATGVLAWSQATTKLRQTEGMLQELVQKSAELERKAKEAVLARALAGLEGAFQSLASFQARTASLDALTLRVLSTQVARESKRTLVQRVAEGMLGEASRAAQARLQDSRQACATRTQLQLVDVSASLQVSLGALLREATLRRSATANDASAGPAQRQRFLAIWSDLAAAADEVAAGLLRVLQAHACAGMARAFSQP